MRCPWSGRIIEIYHDTHPHWVVNYGVYAVTLRCKGSLPKEVIQQLKEIAFSLQQTKPASDEAETLRRRHFAILDNSLDAGMGQLPFANRETAAGIHHFLKQYDFDGLQFDHWVVMPNHLHLITAPFEANSVEAFQKAWRRFKSRSAREINLNAGRTGALWQSSWFDRWIRHQQEHERWQKYIKDNPSKAKLTNWPFAR